MADQVGAAKLIVRNDSDQRLWGRRVSAGLLAVETHPLILQIDRFRHRLSRSRNHRGPRNDGMRFSAPGRRHHHGHSVSVGVGSIS